MLIDPDGMDDDWYMNEKTGELYFNKNLSDNSVDINSETYNRIGDNNLFGEMGNTNEKLFNNKESQSIAQRNNYSIEPSQQLIHTKTKTQNYPTGRKNVTQTTGNVTIINEKYTLSPLKNNKIMTKSTILYHKLSQDIFQILSGGKSEETILRADFQYKPINKALNMVINSAKFISNVLTGTLDDVGAPKIYKSWNDYGNGDLVKYKPKQ